MRETFPDAGFGGLKRLIRVSLIEDDPVVRKGIAMWIQQSSDFALAGAWASVEEALPEVSKAAPDVILVDLVLPGVSGTEGIREIRKRWPAICILVLTVHEENDRIVRSICAGADGYLLKSLDPQRLSAAIREAFAGGSPISPEIAKKVVTIFRKLHPGPNSESELTPHERRILQMLVSGDNYKTAAGKLGVSVNTVSYHVRHIYQKLQVHSRAEAVATALRSGLSG